MKLLVGPLFDPFRLKIPQEEPLTHAGAFVFRNGLLQLRIVASNSQGWDHVSVSLAHRTPTWDELEWIKHKFFESHEVAMQLHVPRSKHISIHPYALHLWRPHDTPIPLPPESFV